MQESRSNDGMFWLVLGIAALAGAYLFRGGGMEGGSFQSFANRQLPAIESSGTWINSESPISWSSMAGKVVWLEFSFIH